MDGGWIKVYRDFTKWEWYSDIKIARVFFHLLLTANHKAVEWKGIVIQPGQRMVSLQGLADETGLTIREVRTVLKKLENTNDVTSKTTNKFTLISIVNWRKYQTDSFYTDTQNDIPVTNKRQTNDNQITTNKNEKNEKKEKNEKNINISTFLSDAVESFSEKEQKHCYGQYNNVLLTDSEVSQLKARFGSSYKEKLDSFSYGLELKGYRYNNHYLAMLKWYGDEKPEREDVLLMNMDKVPVFNVELNIAGQY